MSKLALQLIAENKKTKAKFLDLGNCGLGSPPYELYDCVWLERLNLGDFYYHEVAQKRIKTKNNWSGNSFFSLDLNNLIMNLKSLKSLDLANNNLRDYKYLANLTALLSLDLSYTQISDYSFLEYLTGLKSLYLGYNQISDIRFLTKLTRLKSLDLRANLISNFNALKKLTGLVSLNLAHNQISNIRFLETLTDLESLDLRSNQISNIFFLEEMTSLKSLDLSTNQISDIRFLGKLEKLQSLDLSTNQISDIRFLENLRKLQSLDISSNRISDIHFLEKLGQMQSLNLSFNRISDTRVLEKLTSLSQLFLNNNRITNINSLLPLLNKGLEFDLEKKNISELLGKIGLRGNSIQNPPLEILKQGREAVLNWFEERELQGEEVVYEAKLMIIGDAGSGKTSLSTKIKNLKDPLPHKLDDTTIGIDISKFEFKKREDKPGFKVNIWDLGGQKIYHPLHQLFFSRRSLYVLVVNGREENDLDDFWIPVQRLLGKDSPMLILFNQHGNIQSSIPFNHLKASYPNIKGDLSIVDLLNNEVKTKEFISEIEKFLRNLPQFERGEKLPKLWVRIRESVAQKKENYIDLKDFRKLCSEIGISDQKKQDFVSDYLHDLGIILRFRDDALLNKIVFLKPQWALDAIYRVLDHTREHQNGLFRKEDLLCVWDNQEFYDAQDELLALMKKFELCYEIDSEQYLVPSLLPEDLPNDFEWDESNNITLHYEYDFMPKGIISRLIVRLHHLIAKDKLLWREGVIFEYQGATVWLTKFANKRIELYAKGYKPSSLITIITNEIDEINSKYQFPEMSKPSKKVPCICDTCSEKSTPIYYSYDYLVLRDRNGKKTVECTQVPFLEVNVKELIENVKDKSVIKSKKTIVETMKTEPIKIFVTYCWTDKDGKIDEEHQNKVHSLVNALRKRGFNATFDKAINDTCTANDFMRMMVENIDKSDKVIVLLSEGYAVKAKDFKGGVGDEYQLLINDLNENVNKYIFASLVPRTKEIYPFAFKGRDTIDLSKLDAKEIESLIRKINGSPSVLLQEIGEFKNPSNPTEVPPLF
jgi:internalin A